MASWEPEESKEDAAVLNRVWNTIGRGAARPVSALTDAEVEVELADYSAGRTKMTATRLEALQARKEAAGGATR